jgi:hypothetical protein
MAHVLTTVRAWAAAQLAGVPGVGAVLEGEAYPLAPEQIPALVLDTSCAPELESIDEPPVLRWDVQLAVSVLLKASGTGQAAALDALTAALTTALAGTRVVGGQTLSVLPVAVDRPALDVSTDQPIIRRDVVFSVGPLFTTAADPGALV